MGGRSWFVVGGVSVRVVAAFVEYEVGVVVVDFEWDLMILGRVGRFGRGGVGGGGWEGGVWVGLGVGGLRGGSAFCLIFCVGTVACFCCWLGGVGGLGGGWVLGVCVEFGIECGG